MRRFTLGIALAAAILGGTGLAEGGLASDPRLRALSSASATSSQEPVSEISLTLYPGKRRHFVKITVLSDGTAVKRDLTASAVYNGSLPPATFKALARELLAFGEVPSAPLKALDASTWEAAYVQGEAQRKLRARAGKPEAVDRLIRKINSELEKINWDRI